MIERSRLTDQSMHAAHSGGGFRILDIQVDIGGELSVVTVRAQVIGPRYVHRAHRGENRFVAQLPVVSLLSATTKNAPVFDSRGRELQQFTQGRGASPMHGRTHSRFDSFQIQTSRLAAALENHTQKLLYFARDFLADRFDRFFPSDDRVSSTGRARQILSFTSSKSWLSCRKR